MVIPYWTPKFRSRLFAIAILGPCNSHILIPHQYFWLYIWYNINYIPVVKSSSIIMQCYTLSIHPCQLFMSFSVGTNTDLPLLTVVLWSVCTKCWKITAGFVFTNKHESEWGCPAQWQELLLKFTFFCFTYLCNRNHNDMVIINFCRSGCVTVLKWFQLIVSPWTRKYILIIHTSDIHYCQVVIACFITLIRQQLQEEVC